MGCVVGWARCVLAGGHESIAGGWARLSDGRRRKPRRQSVNLGRRAANASHHAALTAAISVRQKRIASSSGSPMPCTRATAGRARSSIHLASCGMGGHGSRARRAAASAAI